MKSIPTSCRHFSGSVCLNTTSVRSRYVGKSTGKENPRNKRGLGSVRPEGFKCHVGGQCVQKRAKRPDAAINAMALPRFAAICHEPPCIEDCLRRGIIDARNRVKTSHRQAPETLTKRRVEVCRDRIRAANRTSAHPKRPPVAMTRFVPSTEECVAINCWATRKYIVWSSRALPSFLFFCDI